MPNLLPRRDFLVSAVAATTLLQSRPKIHAATSPNRRLRVAVMGLGRGLDLARAAVSLPDVELAWLCDIDGERITRAQKALEGKLTQTPRTTHDIRTVLDDKEVDAVFIAAPNHWHAPASIMACAAGKHVYVEKPCSHNPWEGEMMLKAARKYNRLVQMGNQRRSWPGVVESMQQLKDGVIGKVRYARSWYLANRGTIGTGKVVKIPQNQDYNLWQGPAPERPYLDNVVHYNWHWRWHWGNGELGNNGIHALDLVRWGLEVDFPTKVGCTGGRYHFSDDQETPDTTITTFDFGQKGALWDGSSCHPRSQESSAFVTFYGEGGSLSIDGNGGKVFDAKGKEIAKNTGEAGEKGHIANFFNAIRNGSKLNSEIAEGVKSTLLCHLGNIAFRTRSVLDIDPKTGQILHNKEAQKLWKREYRKGWEPKV